MRARLHSELSSAPLCVKSGAGPMLAPLLGRHRLSESLPPAEPHAKLSLSPDSEWNLLATAVKLTVVTGHNLTVGSTSKPAIQVWLGGRDSTPSSGFSIPPLGRHCGDGTGKRDHTLVALGRAFRSASAA